MSRKGKQGRKLKRQVPLPSSDSELSANDVMDMLTSDDDLLTLNNKTKSLQVLFTRPPNDPVDASEPVLGEQFDSGTRRIKDVYAKVFSEKLPVKTKKGKWKVLEEEYVVDRSEDGVSDQSGTESEGDASCTARDFDEGKGLARTFEEGRDELAASCMLLTQDPEHNLKKLSSIKGMIQDERLSSLAMTSMLAVFMDILPGYSIRPLTEQERAETVSKEVKQLRQYEQSLLRHYRDYLLTLRDGITRNDSLSMQIAGQLLINCNHFNYTDQLIQWMTHKAITGNQVCCDAFKKLFEGDRLGRVTMEAVRCISNAIKDRGYDRFGDPRILQAFLSIDLRETAMGVNAGSETVGVDQDILRKQRRVLQHKSKKERKEAKKEKAETAKKLVEETVITKEQRQKWSSETLRFMFRTYFGILTFVLNKDYERSKQLGNSIKSIVPIVMNGMGKFYRYISVEYFSDLTALLRKLIALDMKHHLLTPTASLNCILTVLHIHRSNQNLAPMDLKFAYDYLYWLTDKALSSPPTSDVDEDPGSLYEKGLRSMFMRQAVPINRVCAFIHRLAKDGSKDGRLHERLECILMLFDQHPASRCIIDNDSCDQSNGAIITDIDPDLGDARMRNLNLSDGLERAIRECKKEEQGKLLNLLRQIKRLATSQKDA